MNSKEFLSKIINSNQEDYKKRHKELNDLARKAQDEIETFIISKLCCIKVLEAISKQDKNSIKRNMISILENIEVPSFNLCIQNIKEIILND